MLPSLSFIHNLVFSWGFAILHVLWWLAVIPYQALVVLRQCLQEWQCELHLCISFHRILCIWVHSLTLLVVMVPSWSFNASIWSLHPSLQLVAVLRLLPVSNTSLALRVLCSLVSSFSSFLMVIHNSLFSTFSPCRSILVCHVTPHLQ